MSFQKHHQESETNEYHHVNILIEWVVCLHFVLSSKFLCSRCKDCWVDTISICCKEAIKDNKYYLTDNEYKLEYSVWIVYFFFFFFTVTFFGLIFFQILFRIRAHLYNFIGKISYLK